MATLSIEERLAAVEAELGELKKHIKATDSPWWEQWVGAFQNDPVFDSAMQYGAEYRRTLTNDESTDVPS